MQIAPPVSSQPPISQGGAEAVSPSNRRNTCTTAQRIETINILTIVLISTAIVLSGTYLVTTFARFSFELLLGTLIFGLALIIQTITTFRTSESSLSQASIFVFTFIFLWIAPIIQLTELRFTLVNTSRFDEYLFLATNSLCALFSVVFTIYSSRLHNATFARSTAQRITTPYTNIKIGRLVAISTVLALTSLLFINILLPGDAAITPLGLFLRKFLFFIPCTAFLTVLSTRVTTIERPIHYLPYVLILFVLLVLTQNPLTEKRNSLGPIYLSVIFIFTGKTLTNRVQQLAVLMIALLIFFPLSSVYTHIRNSAGFSFETNYVQIISDHFLSTHYDAWANIYAAVELVQYRGLQYGQQLLGSLLFFVPSQMWPDKPVATGILLADFLAKNHMMWFTNLSGPLIAEAIVDFHWLGVIIYAMILAKFASLLDRFALDSHDPFVYALATYWSIFLIFLLRGSLMIAFAYGLGATAAFFAARFMCRGDAAPAAGRIRHAASHLMTKRL